MNGEQIGKLLLARENVRVSFHAVGQFRERVADLPETVARKIILEGVRTAENVRLLPDGETLRIRTRRPFPFEFRAILVYDEEFEAPVVTTVLRGDSWKIRKKRARGEKQFFGRTF
jgi:UDP:flavonoid glycosyltransferase YjiC (YdhE family)